MPPENHDKSGVAPRPLVAPLRLRFGPFLPGRPLPRSDGEDGPCEEAVIFHRHCPPTQTDVSLHLRRRLSLIHRRRAGGRQQQSRLRGARGQRRRETMTVNAAREGSRRVFSKRVIRILLQKGLDAEPTPNMSRYAYALAVGYQANPCASLHFRWGPPKQPTVNIGPSRASHHVSSHAAELQTASISVGARSRVIFGR